MKNDFTSIHNTVESVNSAKLPGDLNIRHLICIGDNAFGLDHKLNMLRYRNLEVVSKSDTGLYNGMNKGLSQIESGWVMFLNAGDELANSNSLLDIANAIRNSDTNIIQLQTQIQHKITPRRKYSRLELFLGREMHAHPSFIFNYDQLRDLRFDEKYTIVADYKFVLEAMKHAHVTFQDVIIVKFEGGGISSQNLKTLISESNQVRLELSAYVLRPLILLWNLKVRLFSHL